MFSSRRSSDSTVIPKQLDFAAAPSSPALLYEHEASNNPGALYYRFAVRVHNRYAGLLRENASLESLIDPLRGVERWKRLVIPCRWKREVPKPLIKLIIPLTHTRDEEPDVTIAARAGGLTNESKTPGLLVVLDESWFLDSFAGLAESIEGEIIRVARPDLPEDKRPKFGPDPMLTLEEEPFADSEITLPGPVGPVGYTFDTDTEAPLFVKCSFVQPPPQIDGGTKTSPGTS